MRRKFIIVLLLAAMSCFLEMACSEKRPEYQQIQAIPDAAWSKDNVLNFTIPVIDTIAFYDLQIDVRNRADYPFSNLFLFVTVTAPTGAQAVDTLEYRLATEQGEWLGKGSSQIWDNRLPYRRNISFPVKGDYHFQIRHGMRTEPLPGITDVGLRLNANRMTQ